jgi:hypothetical protein
MWIEHLQTLTFTGPPLNGEKHELSALMFFRPIPIPCRIRSLLSPTRLCKSSFKTADATDEAMIANDPHFWRKRDWDDDSRMLSLRLLLVPGWE